MEFNYFLVFLSSALVNNFVMSRFLGICPFLGVSQKIESAFGMGVAVTFVMALASAVTHVVYRGILLPSVDMFLEIGGAKIPLDVEYLYNIAFILIIASLVQFVEMFIKKSSPSLHGALGVYLPLITTNCAVLGVTVINKDTAGANLLFSIVNGVGAAVGFTIVIVMFAGIRERLEMSAIPKPFRGFPIALVTAGLMSVAFLGFQGLIQ
jgi:electron transport complex protein RnfA